MPEPRVYRHLLSRVDYARGYRYEPDPLPDYIHLEIRDTESGSKILSVHSRIHKNQAVDLTPQYSSSWSDQDIIRDLSGEIYCRWLRQ